MLDNIIISGFADEIDMNLDEQLRVVKELGMNYICVRAADGKGIADYTPEEFQEKILPRLKAAGVGVSSLGSPIGKIDIDDEEAYATQLKQLENLCQICKLVDCKYIRMFSFWMPKDKNPDDFTDQVLEKLEGFAKVAEKYDVILIHENEKDIYGDAYDEGSAKVSKYYALAATYSNGPLNLVLLGDVYDWGNVELTTRKWSKSIGNGYTATFGGSYDFGLMKLYADVNYFHHVRVKDSLKGVHYE